MIFFVSCAESVRRISAWLCWFRGEAQHVSYMAGNKNAENGDLPGNRESIKCTPRDKTK